jgi:signal transduction histidine kinase
LKIVRDFIQNVENYKVYNFILIVTVAFIIIIGNSFYYIRDNFENLAEQKRVLIVKDMDHEIKTWLLERVTNMENSAKFVDEIYDDEETLEAFSTIFMKNNKSFDAVQMLIPDLYLYVNGVKIDDYVKHYTDSYGERYYYKSDDEELWYLKLKWFTDTKKGMKTTMETMQEHGFLHVKTINICTPIDRNNEFKGVYCGIIKADSLFDKIKSFEMPKGSYYLIIDENGNILTEFNNSSLNLDEIKEAFSANFAGSFTKNIHTDKGVITMDILDDFGWYIVAGVNKSEVHEEALEAFLKHAVLISIFFIIFIVLVNGSYTFLYSRLDTKKREYKKMLEYSSRMSEVGELVSAINHQLRQPLNSLALITSGTIKLLSRDVFDKKTIESNLKLSQKSITLMDKTINIFRNFYRSDNEISEFYLKDAINGVLQVVYTNASQKNIMICMHDKNIKNLKIVSMENFVQQILLVLIQNSIDAIAPMEDLKRLDKRSIEIKFEVHEKSVDIDVVDFGRGVKEGIEKSIFSAFYKSSKRQGFGMGLFFAKKLANKKLMGDIMLIQNFNPTIFRFSIRKICKV